MTVTSLTEQIKNKTQESIQGEVEALSSTFDEIQKNIMRRIEVETRSNRAEFYSQLAASFTMGFEQEFVAFIFRIFSAREYATLKSYDGLTQVLNHAISEKGLIRIPPGKEKERAKAEKLAEGMRTTCLEEVDKLRKILEEQGVKNRFSELLAKVDDFCKNFVLVADKPE